MQMRGRKYIRFDFAQALHTQATSTERHDYRIIARTRRSHQSLTRALARSVHCVHNEARVRARSFCAAVDASSLNSRFAHRLRASPRIVVAHAGALERACGTDLTRVRQRVERRHWRRRAYQIETTRMLIAIEFFFVVTIKFLSMRRCNRPFRRANRDDNEVIRSAIRFEVRRRDAS
jgi:hypothetical protein